MKNSIPAILLGLLALLFSNALFSAPIDKSTLSPRIAALSAATAPEPCNLDFDGNGTEDALTDGILFMRYLSGYTDAALVDGALGAGATRTTGAEITAFLDQSDCTAMKDVDGNGTVDAATDGVLLVRYLFGFSGRALVQDALAVDAKRTGSNEILDLLAFYQNPRYAIIEGTVAEGGRISDTWEDIIIEGKGPGSSTVRFIEGKTYSGDVAFTLDTTGGEVQLLLPDAALLDPPTTTSAGMIAKAQAAASSDGYPLQHTWLSAKDYFSWLGNEALINKFRYNRLPLGSNRISSFKQQTNPGIRKYATYQLLSVCNKSDASCYPSSKDPVLLVHGYLIGDDIGGGEDTWKDFPSLLLKEGYVPFEFRWNTSARFHDVAVDLGGAIKKIAEKTGKKVHVIAHSFGGLLTRTLLQQLATWGNDDYGQYVASVTTLGTPHSGILDASSCAHGLPLPIGQDSILFEGCGQISCQQAGEPVFNAEDSAFFGIHEQPGSIPVSLANSFSSLPDVDIQVLIGLTTEKQDVNGTAHYYYTQNGDGLISAWGQRFSPDNATIGSCSQGNIDTSWGSLLHAQTQGMGSARVTEGILGFPDTMKPGGLTLDPRADEPGYRHSTYPWYMKIPGSSYVLPLHATPEVNVDCTTTAGCTHDGYIKSLAWIKSHPSGLVASGQTVTFDVSVVAAADGQAIQGALVTVYDRESSGAKVAEGYTAADGTLVLAMPFLPNNTYKVMVVAPSSGGYRPGISEFTTGIYAIGSHEFSRNIELVSLTLANGQVTGSVTDVNSNPLDGVEVQFQRMDHFKPDDIQTTDTNGGFTNALLPGTWKLTFIKAGFIRKTMTVTIVANATKNITATLDAGTDTSTGLVAHYTFDGTLLDKVGKTQAGKAYNGASFADGVRGQSIEFDGINDYVKIPHSDLLNVVSAKGFTIAFWVNYTGAANNEYSVPMSKGFDCDNAYGFTYSGQRFVVGDDFVNCSESPDPLASTIFNANEWHHVVGVINPGADYASYYVDGIKIADTSPAFGSPIQINNQFPLVLGRQFANADGSGGFEYPFEGKIDELRIYDKALTAQDVQVLYDSEKPVVPVSLRPLNDTGITWGGDYPDGNNSTCTSNIAAPQDCRQGRDATHNDDSDGHAGFSFTKLDASGNPLPPSATSWSCVKDNVTGLIWEAKTTDGGIHDMNNTYRWGGITHQGSGYGTYYDDWDTLVNGSNSEALCGYSDWRVPTVEELQSIVDYSRYGPAIDTHYFPNTTVLSESSYWSSNPYTGFSERAWFVGFDYGGDTYGGRAYTYRVRLVRATQ